MQKIVIEDLFKCMEMLYWVESHHFEELIENYKLTKGVLLDTELDENDWDGLINDFKKVVREKTKKEFPQDVLNNYWVQ